MKPFDPFYGLPPALVFEEILKPKPEPKPKPDEAADDKTKDKSTS